MNFERRVRSNRFLLPIFLTVAPTIAPTIFFTGCLGSQTQETLDAMQSSSNGASPFVEGTIEYVGVPSRWSGPGSASLHILAKDLAMDPQVQWISSQQDSPLKKELPLSGVPNQKLSAAVVRERLGLIAHAMTSNDALPFSNCFYPVRVRLVRQSGEVVDKQGCRSETGWTHTVSEAVNDLLTASKYGVATLTQKQMKDLTPQEKSTAPVETSPQHAKSEEPNKATTSAEQARVPAAVPNPVASVTLERKSPEGGEAAHAPAKSQASEENLTE